MASKKKDKFFTHLMDISLNLKESVNYFADYQIKNISDLKIFSEKMKEYESRGDVLVHDLIIDLNLVFITPIEREDILSLSLSMDDILDGLHHTAALFEMYSVIETDEFMHQFVDAIRNSVYEIDLAIKMLSTKKLLSIREHVLKIKDLESSCDHILRGSIKQLFASESNPIRIIQYKEIYEGLEEIADSCQAVANMFETIIMKNS
ncbi:putative phosphate transport protein (TIGR00153 family) [Bacillus sp. SLBN-46]|uniref:DUF47 domain-containing protein n=1 Tax=Bacillus sp. SLBN-46 TaxID=3042283 RepID=UPI0028585C47|nr:DUF47 domain-containing protein [Bacillus sp. SLBN-46]MDR6123433.1 putative phosphate transport protein (TIGR00153 family) [Bacillus sp. SLBN-46]